MFFKGTGTRPFERLLIVTDFLSISLPVIATSYLRFGGFTETFDIAIDGFVSSVPYVSAELFSIALFMILLAGFKSRKPNILGASAKEYALVVRASTTAFLLIVFFAFILNAHISRILAFLAYLSIVLMLLVTRWLCRKLLLREWRSRKLLQSTFVIGNSVSVVRFVQELSSRPEVGLEPIGTFIVPERAQSYSSDLGLDLEEEILRLIDESGAQSIIFAGAEGIGPEGIRALCWQLDPQKNSVYLATGILDVGAPRIEIRPAGGIPLMSVKLPEYSGMPRLIKRVFDFTFSLLGILAAAPFLLLVGVLIWLDSGRPIFFTQTRVGLEGREFRIFKLRTMVLGESALPEGLHPESYSGNEVLFKLKRDPRVTKVGGFLRRWSIDEVPQLINILNGTMSFVGPRPPLPVEVEKYLPHVHRKFLVKPGLTGLWQVSGRSDLSWEKSVEIDLHYVENWSLINDLVIIYRTFKAVFSKAGAY